MKMNLGKRNADMRSFFNEKADGYDEVHGEKHLFDTKIALVDRVPDGCRTFLDLGVGTGLELTLLFEKLPDARVYGVDISENMLAKLAQRPFADRVTAVNGDFFDVAFTGGNFPDGYDAVISSSALHHFAPEDKRRLYAKVFDALLPGGCFICADCIYSTYEEEKRVFDNYEQLLTEWRHVDTPLAEETERRLLTEAGFSDITFTQLENPLYKLLFAKKQ